MTWKDKPICLLYEAFALIGMFGVLPELLTEGDPFKQTAAPTTYAYYEQIIYAPCVCVKPADLS